MADAAHAFACVGNLRVNLIGSAALGGFACPVQRVVIFSDLWAMITSLDFRRRQQKLVQSNRCKTGPGKAVAGRPVASVA